MPFRLPPLPYAPEALEPYMSARTLEFHHGKHHKAYVEKANAAIAGTPLEGLDEREVIRRARADGNQSLFNNAAQAWNHEFLWQSLEPNGGGSPDGALRERLERDFGGLESFSELFAKEAAGHFGSGWAWLVLSGDALKVVTTHDADTPIARDGETPLLVLDLWEHAYYLDYQNARPEFIKAFLGHLANWDFASTNLANAERKLAAA